MLPHFYFLEGTSIVIYNLNLFNMAIVIFKYEQSILSKIKTRAMLAFNQRWLSIGSSDYLEATLGKQLAVGKRST